MELAGAMTTRIGKSRSAASARSATPDLPGTHRSRTIRWLVHRSRRGASHCRRSRHRVDAQQTSLPQSIVIQLARDFVAGVCTTALGGHSHRRHPCISGRAVDPRALRRHTATNPQGRPSTPTLTCSSTILQTVAAKMNQGGLDADVGLLWAVQGSIATSKNHADPIR